MLKKAQMKPQNSMWIWFLIFSALFLSMSFMKERQKIATKEIGFNVFLKKLEEKKIIDANIVNDQIIKGTLNSDVGVIEYFTIGDTKNQYYINKMIESGVQISYSIKREGNIFLTLLLGFGPIILLVWLLYYFTNKGKEGLGGFSKAKFKVLSPSADVVSFEDVAGVDESKEELKEIVDFLKDPAAMTALGATIPKGALLVGPPGTGKTMLAKAVASTAGVPFLSISGSDFIEMFVGVGASRVRDLFNQARSVAPCIIFIDEIDAIGKKRSSGGFQGSNDERDQTLNQLLVEMDGFSGEKGIIVMAATNRVDVLDEALLRPGRFDRRVFVQLPDIVGREKILQIHGKKTKLAEGVDLKIVARGTPGFSGADLANLINEAALLAARHKQKEIRQIDLEEARDKIMMGPQRISMKMTPDDKKTTAYHEAGHAIIADLLEVDPVHKVTIIPRGQAMGLTQTMPEENQLSISEEKAKKMIAMLMGGRAAEEIVFGHLTTGASNDIERASMIARKMVTEWGMSPLGNINYTSNPQKIYSDVSEETKKTIDDTISKIISDQYTRTIQTLKDNREMLVELSEKLIEKETLDAKEIQEIIIKHKKSLS